jgi:tetratricopeptide (TPR) repeat protein
MKFKPFRRINSLVLFVPVLIFMACDSRQTKLQRFLIQGNEMAQKQNFDQARRYFNEALKLDSCFVDAWNNLGTISHRQHHFQEALEHYNHVIACDSKFHSVRLNRANTLYELNRVDEALNDLLIYEQNNPDTFIVHFSRGLLLSRQKKFPEALVSFHKALNKSSGNVEVLVNIGVVHYSMHDLDSAQTYLQRALSIADDEPNIFNTLALVEIERHRLDEALHWIDRAISLQRSNSFFLNNRGYIHLLSGNLDRAIDDINESISEDPYNAWAYRNKGLYYFRKNDFQNSVRLLKRAEEIDSTIDSLYTYLARSTFKLSKSEGRTYYRKARIQNQVSEAEVFRFCH